jgi:hypothetical protein
MLIEYIKEDKIALIDSEDKRLIEKFLLNGYEIKLYNNKENEELKENFNNNLENNDIIEDKQPAKKRGRVKKEVE